LRRQSIDDRLEAAQLVARLKHAFRAVVHLEQVEIGEEFERDDLRAPRLVDQQIADDLEEIGSAMGDPLEILRRESANQGFRNEIVTVMAGWQDATKPRPQCPFMRQDMLLEPVKLRSGRLHGPSPKSVDPLQNYCRFSVIKRTRGRNDVQPRRAETSANKKSTGSLWMGWQKSETDPFW